MTRHYHTIFNLVALSIIVYVSVDIFYSIAFSGIEQVDGQRVVTRKVQDIKRNGMSLDNFKPITERNLFGTVNKASKDNTSEDIEALEPTSLSLALLGTVTGNNQDARAVIEEIGKRKQGLYKVGDSIQNGTVKMILNGKVVLRVGNKDEILSIEDSLPSKTGNLNRVQLSRNKRVSTITVKRSDVRRALNDINKLMSQVFVRPHSKDGIADGLEVTRIKRGSFFASLGLKNGDVIQKINNRPIKSPDDAMVFYNRLKTGSRVSIEITRGEKSKTINYRFR
ncbi:MAG: type II secretion system protein N [Candidatus Auribacterota bacterium]|nr:type II secretion system protein N [Candidatus Auribacterota bacterium]